MAISGHRLRNDGSGLHRRMQIDFADPRRQPLEYRQQLRFIHSTRSQQHQTASLSGICATSEQRLPISASSRSAMPAWSTSEQFHHLLQPDAVEPYQARRPRRRRNISDRYDTIEILLNIDIVELSRCARRRRGSAWIRSAAARPAERRGGRARGGASVVRRPTRRAEPGISFQHQHRRLPPRTIQAHPRNPAASARARMASAAAGARNHALATINTPGPTSRPCSTSLVDRLRPAQE